MEDALVTRLRAAAGIVAVSGKFESRPAVDVIERRSDDAASFPATTIQKLSPGRTYSQDGADGLVRPRIRLEVFGLDYGTTKILARALILELEQRKTAGGIRFHRGQLQFERDFSPEDIGGNLKIFRTVLDFFLPYTPT